MNKHSYLISLVPLRLLFLLVLSLMVVSMQGQDENVVSLDYKKAPLSKALDTLRTYTNDYNITFVHNDIEHLQVTLRAINQTIPDAVELICKGQPVKVKIKGNDIIVKYLPDRDRTIALWGHVCDSFTKHGILGAKISLINEDGVVLDTTRTWQPNNDRDDAVYRFEVPVAPRKYRFLAEHPDYDSTSVEYSLRHVARNDFFDVPHTFMQKKTLQLNGGDLGEVVVKATKVQMVYRGDTLVYNADAFNVPEGSMLDAIIKQMPGVELKANGEIYVQGRKVDFLTLNGENFFKGKNKILLENLPYYTVKNIEVYEKQTEKSEWLGVQEAPKDYVMDVVLKREYRKGYLANLQAGAGTEGRFVGKAFGQRYTDHSSLNVIFNGNNINEFKAPSSKGDWNTSKNQSEGVTDMKKSGVNLSINDKDKRWTEDMNVQLGWAHQHKESHTSTEHFQPDGNEFSRNVSNQHYRDFRVEGSNTFTLRKPFWFRNVIGIYYGHNTSHGYQRYGRFTKDPSWIGGPQIVLDSAFHYSPELMNVLVNMRNNDDIGSETNWFVEYKPNLSYKFVWGDDIDLWGRFLYENHRQKENEQVLTEGYSSDQRNKQLVYDNKKLNWEAGVQYTVHSHSHWNYRAAVGYYYKRNKEENERYLEPIPNPHPEQSSPSRSLPLREGDNKASFVAVPFSLTNQSPLPWGGDGGGGGLDPHNSYTYTFTSKRVTPMAMIYYQRDNQKKHRSTWFSFSVPLHIEKQQIAYRSDTTFARRIVLPTPEIRYECSYNQGLNFLYFTYNTEYFTPTMLNMVNTFFDYDPLNIQMGNGNLKNSFKHRFVVNYKIGKKSHNQYLRFDGGVNIHQNQIVRGQTYDPRTGVTYYQYANVKGNWDSWGQLSFGRMLDAQNRLWFETRTGLSYTHYVGISALLGESNGKSVVTSWSFPIHTLLRYRLNKLTVSGNLNYAKTWNKYIVHSRGSETHFQPTTIQYGLSGQYEIPILQGSDGRGLQIATDMVLYVKRGYGDSSMNTNDFVWNASIAKSLWKNKVVVKLEGFDILNQLSNIYSTVDAQGRVETWRNMVPSFVMLHLHWHFSRLPKKK